LQDQTRIDQIRARLEKIHENIRIAIADSGRKPGSVRLVVVTKGHPVESISAATAAGATDIGENYVQEALAKMQPIKDFGPVHWHMIGHIQSRKAALVATNFDIVHSVDSLKLANRLNHSAEQAGISLPILLEYNVSGEQSKFGWDATNQANWPKLVPEVEEILELNSLNLSGLMTMAPYFPDPEMSRPYFRKLRELANTFRSEFGAKNFQELSMGMSQDYLVAIQEGATIIRIGTAIMGSRPN
jgi:pyridoxal phosphate enzyme (YggS family)